MGEVIRKIIVMYRVLSSFFEPQSHKDVKKHKGFVPSVS